MDPDQAYADLMQAVSDYEDERGTAGHPRADEMRDAIRGLDDWLTGGGFLPSVWQR